MPDFIVFGTPKSGTSAFHRALGSHPQVFCTTPKEPNFFCYPEILSKGRHSDYENDIKYESAYLSLFRDASDSQIRGEASICYFFEDSTAKRIYKHLPHIKLIAILRHPVDRAYSAWLQSRNAYEEPISDFMAACEAGPKRTASDWNRGWNYLDTGYYAHHLKRWFSVFPRNQFKIFLYEDWQQNPKKVLRETFQFLGIPTDDSITVTRDNVTSIRPRSAWLHSLLSPSQRLRSIVQRILPVSVRAGTTRFLRRINSGRSAPLDPSVRAKLTARYEADITELETLINRDLCHWRAAPQSLSKS